MRRRPAGPGLSLFPFLSILMCSIGVLIVVFAGTALTALESTDHGYVVTVRGEPPIVPGRKIERQPIYVVCDSRGLEIFRSPTERILLPAADFDELIATGEVTRVVRMMVGLRRTRWPVLFVKPSGLRYMRPLYNELKETELRVGKFAFAEDSILECQIVDGAQY